MAYSHVTEEERKHIYEWRQDGLGFRVNGRSASMDAPRQWMLRVNGRPRLSERLTLIQHVRGKSSARAFK